MKAIRLKVSDLIHPVGIDDRKPRFSWNCEGGKEQRAFRLVAHQDTGALLYDSDRVESHQMFCRYDGQPLQSRMVVLWKVCLWDENNTEEWSDVQSFEMGLLDPSDWKARWICGHETDIAAHLPADCYRRVFPVAEPARKARLYVTSLGIYTAAVNGVRVSSVLAPGSSEYAKHLYYQTYDVTELVNGADTCELCFSVADGWYKGKLGADQCEFLFGTRTELFAQLEIEYISGRRECIATGPDFSWSNDGPVRFADLKDGEIVDARMTPSFSRYAVVDEQETRIPVASNAANISEHETFTPQLERSPSGEAILDFGQNMAGYIKFRTAAPEGTQIRIRLFEATDHGEYSNASLSFPDGNVEPVRQEILYTASGREEEYSPSFFYSGFRYALVEGLDSVNPGDFTAVAIYSDLDYNGSFTCSDPMLNRLVKNTIWSMKSNFVDVPTDCPQREKSGWTGDAQVFCRTAAYFADTKAFFRKWLRDVRDCQKESGLVINVCPHVLPDGSPMDFVNGSCGWADAAVIIPWTLWRITGDEQVIRENLALMRGWAHYVMGLCADKSMFSLTEDNPLFPMKPIYDMCSLPDSPWNRYIPESGIHWGEWSVPASEEPPEADPAVALMRPKQEVTCAYTHYSMSKLAEMLSAIGEEEEASICREYAVGSLRAYHEHWIKQGTVHTEHMAELVRPIALGLTVGDEKKNIAALLNQMVIQRNYKVGTGFLSTPFLLRVLADNDYTDTAYRMLENRQAPGWLAMVEQGATTIWEEYVCYGSNGAPLPRSMNHYSLGAVCGFLFDSVCGIRITSENTFEIVPKPGGTLQYAEAVTQTAYGEVRSRWERNGDSIDFCIAIPSNTKATVTLPDGSQQNVSSGTHRFTIAG